MELIEIIKNRLDYTWTDDATDKKLQNIIDNGVARLDQMSGVKNDYTQTGQAQALLVEYVFYALADSLDNYFANYQSEINTFISYAKLQKAFGTDWDL